MEPEEWPEGALRTQEELQQLVDKATIVGGVKLYNVHLDKKFNPRVTILEKGACLIINGTNPPSTYYLCPNSSVREYWLNLGSAKIPYGSGYGYLFTNYWLAIGFYYRRKKYLSP